MTRLWIRWGWRDFRARWPQILATALTLAVGVGGFAGLRSLEEWRVQSANQSLESLRSADLRVDLAAGSYLPRGALEQAISDLPPNTVSAAREQLLATTQVATSQKGEAAILPARLVGMPGEVESEPVDSVAVVEPSGNPRPGANRATVLDWNFADYYGLPPTGRIRIAGLGPVSYSALGVSPRYFVIVDEAGIAGAQGSLATVYMPLALAQRAIGQADVVNQLLLRYGGDDPGSAERLVRRQLEENLPGEAFTLTRNEDEPGTRQIIRDAENDQEIYTAFAILLLLGAGLAAFNLVSRAVESQRREIGIGMALGADLRLLVRRPLLLALQIGVLGVVLGALTGLGLAAMIQSLLNAVLPLPVHASTFPLGLYAQAALIGLLIPLLAAALPLRRALRVDPVEAISPGYRSADGPGAGRLLRRLRLSGGPLVELPVRNLGRRPRRVLMTALGLGAILSAVVAILAMVDTIDNASERALDNAAGSTPDRLVASVDPQPTGSTLVREISRTDGVEASEPGLRLPAVGTGPEDELGLLVTFVDPDSSIWSPALETGQLGPGLLAISRKAADDLGVEIGDQLPVTFTYRRAGRELKTRPRIGGITEDPIRAIAYMSVADQRRLGLGEVTNQIALVPTGTDTGQIQKSLFGVPGVASVRPATDDAEALERTVESFAGAIQMVVAITLALALLVAFTAASATADERRREYATLFAFGVPIWRGLVVTIVESLLIGLMGTVIGLLAGGLIARWIVTALLADTMPDLGFQLTFTIASLVTTVAVGIGAVALAPLLTSRRLARMDIPSTLRVME